MKINTTEEQGEKAINNLIVLTSCNNKDKEKDIIKELEEQGVFN